MSETRRAHTLIELMVVIAIIGVMVVLAADLPRGVTAPQLREQRTFAQAVDQQRLLAQLRADLDHARDVTRLDGGGILVLSAFASRPDVTYTMVAGGMRRHARGRDSVYPGQFVMPPVREESAGGVVVRLAVMPMDGGERVLVSRFFPGGAR